MNNALKVLILFILASVSIGIYFLDSFTLQFFYMTLCASIFFIVLACTVKNIFIQYTAIILFSLLLTITGFEFYFAPSTSVPTKSSPPPTAPATNTPDINAPKKTSPTANTPANNAPTANAPANNAPTKNHPIGMSSIILPSGPIFIEDKDLGYKLKPNVSIPAQRFFGHGDGNIETIYDITYSTNELGNRITPVNPKAKTAVVLLGCSFTMGQGLNDHETFAYKLGQSLGEQYQVINLGVDGYGTHQVYSIIQSKLAQLKKYDNIIAYYLALATHGERAAGLSPWDQDGPRYLIDDNKVIRDGTFKKQYPYNYPKVHEALSKSFLYQRYYNHLRRLLIPNGITYKRNKLLNALITEAITEFKRQYPNSTFNILAWENKDVKALTNLPKDVEISQVTTWLPDYDTKPELYKIKYDGHPNALANSIMAEKLAALVKKDEQKLKK